MEWNLRLENGVYVFSKIGKPAKTAESRVAELEAENAELRARVSDIELAFAELITTGGM